MISPARAQSSTNSVVPRSLTVALLATLSWIAFRVHKSTLMPCSRPATADPAHSLARKSDDTIWASGWNGLGQRLIAANVSSAHILKVCVDLREDALEPRLEIAQLCPCVLSTPCHIVELGHPSVDSLCHSRDLEPTSSGAHLAGQADGGGDEVSNRKGQARSAVSGRYVTRRHARRHPAKTIVHRGRRRK